MDVEVLVGQKDTLDDGLYEYKKALWNSRRGMLELEYLLIPFVESVFSHLHVKDRDAYMKLLALEDPDIYIFLLTEVVPEDTVLAGIIGKIRSYHDSNSER